MATHLPDGHRFEGHTSHISSLAFSPDGRLLASSSTISDNLGKHLIFWDVETLKLCPIAPHDIPSHIKVLCLRFSPDGKLLATGGSDGIIRISDVETGHLVGNLIGHKASVGRIAFSPDGNLIASGSRDETARVWDVTTGEVRFIFEGHQITDYYCGTVHDLAFSPDGQLLATGADDMTVQLSNVQTGQRIKVLRVGGFADLQGIRSLAFSPDGRLLAVGTEYADIQIWDVVKGEKLYTLEHHAEMHSILSLRFSPNGLFLASLSDKDIKLWGAGNILERAKGVSFELESDEQIGCSEIAFSPDGRLFAVGVHVTGENIDQYGVHLFNAFGLKTQPITPSSSIQSPNSSDLTTKVYSAGIVEPLNVKFPK